MILEGKFQIGKNGITQGIINSMNLNLKTHNRLRVSILKSTGRDKNKIKTMAEDLINKLNYNCNYRIIGFTIILRKQSKKQK